MSDILLGLQQFADPIVVTALVGGVLLGLSVGALPGLNDVITISVLIPLTFGMKPAVALALLIGVYSASATGGSIPAVLFEIPGTASAMLTAADGHAMCQKGRTKQALSLCMTSSFIGGISAALVLMFFAPSLAKWALKFGAPEYFMLAVLGMSSVVGMAGQKAAKNFLSMCLGLWIACIGMSPTTGGTRFYFNNINLIDGIPLVPQMIGLFGICSLLKLMDAVNRKQKDVSQMTVDNAHQEAEDKIGLPSRKMCRRLLPTWITSSAIGNVLGIIPGAGMSMAIFIAYDTAKKRNPKLDFGSGIPEGIAAPEAANNAVIASSMVPLMALGIPGNGTSALFLGALTIHGLRAGTQLFQKTPEIAYMMILGFIFANILMLPMALLFCKYLATRVLKINPKLLAGCIVVLCVTGSYAYAGNAFHVGITVMFGLLGYLFWKYSIPQAPLILTTVLGNMIETNYISSMVYGQGVSIFFTRPICLVLAIVSIIFMLMPIIQMVKRHVGSSNTTPQ